MSHDCLIQLKRTWRVGESQPTLIKPMTGFGPADADLPVPVRLDIPASKWVGTFAGLGHRNLCTVGLTNRFHPSGIFFDIDRAAYLWQFSDCR
jgi:hypothetical protein